MKGITTSKDATFDGFDRRMLNERERRAETKSSLRRSDLTERITMAELEEARSMKTCFSHLPQKETSNFCKLPQAKLDFTFISEQAWIHVVPNWRQLKVSCPVVRRVSTSERLLGRSETL